MKKIIAVANQKGGVGKTTTSINLSAALAISGYRVLLIDLDPQAHSTINLGIDPFTQTHTINDVMLKKQKIINAIIETSTKNLEFVPANIRLDKGEQLLNTEFFKEGRLHNAIENLDYDLIIIDCRPTLGTLTINALYASNFVLVPCEMAPFSLEGFVDLLDTIDQITLNEGAKNQKEIRVLLTKFLITDKKVNEWVLKELEPHSEILFKTRIRKSTALTQAQTEKKTIFEYEKGGRGAEDYNNLRKELLEICQISKSS
jgi:chromosome partitioning protein